MSESTGWFAPRKLFNSSEHRAGKFQELWHNARWFSKYFWIRVTKSEQRLRHGHSFVKGEQIGSLQLSPLRELAMAETIDLSGRINP